MTEPSSFEIRTVQLNGPTPSLIVTIVHTPIIIAELTSILADLCAKSPDVILTGDLNIQLIKPTEIRFHLCLG